MKLVCPSCGASAPVEAWVNKGLQEQILRIVAELPASVAARVWHYHALFRPLSGRGLDDRRSLRILSALRDEVGAPTIQWKRQPARPSSARCWAEAMERILQRPPGDLPLTSHGYLKSIAYQIANETDRHAEVAHNKAERSGAIQAGRAATTEAPEPIDPEWMREIAEKKLGRKPPKEDCKK